MVQWHVRIANTTCLRLRLYTYTVHVHTEYDTHGIHLKAPDILLFALRSITKMSSLELTAQIKASAREQKDKASSGFE